MNALTNSIRHYLPTLKLLLICTELSLILCILNTVHMLKKKFPMDWFHVYGVKNTQYERQLSAYKKKLQGRKIVANAIRL
jgi:hypothetical protein